MSSIYDFAPKLPDGQPKPLADYRGHALLIVNTASKCGFTPQYAGLEALHRKYGKRGFEVLGCPCNQFGAQEPGDAAEIAHVCSLNYDVDFPLFAKIDVNGAKAEPLYGFLKRKKRGIFGTASIKWNFTKFLIGPDGRVIGRFAPTVKPEALAAKIEKLLPR
jgi:glutathione peroxidase